MKKIIVIWVLLLHFAVISAGLIPLVAFAQATPVPPVDQGSTIGNLIKDWNDIDERKAAQQKARQDPKYDSSRAIGYLLGAIQKSVNSASDPARVNSLNAIGLRLTGMLFVISLSWSTIRSLMDGSDFRGMISVATDRAMMLGVVLLFLGQVPSFGSIGSILVNSVDALGEILTGVGRNDPVAAMGKTMEAAFAMFSGVGSAISAWNTGTFISGMINTVVAAIFAIGSIFLMLVAVAVYMGIYIMSQIMINIAFMFMPVMVPWLLWGATDWVFNGWLKFMLSAALQKVIGLVMFLITGGMIESIVNMQREMAPGSSVTINYVAFGAILCLSALTVFLMWQTPGIAQGLLSGSAQGGGLRPGAMLGGGSGSALSKNVGSAAKSAGSQAGGAAKAAGSGFDAKRAWGASKAAGGSVTDRAKAAISSAKSTQFSGYGAKSLKK